MNKESTILEATSRSSESTYELGEVKFIRIPMGTFAGTREVVFVVRGGELVALNTGDQAGGQN
ncbi:MAG: hypothetical protein JO271_11975 [Verrucomicrobia bacterium]|nr:hypothetical protein [Verrucomicrobiota bacterium]